VRWVPAHSKAVADNSAAAKIAVIRPSPFGVVHAQPAAVPRFASSRKPDPIKRASRDVT